MLAKKFALGFGIAVIFPMLVHYGVSVFSPEPRWEDYHIVGQPPKDATREERAKREQKGAELDEKWKEDTKRFEKRLFLVAAPVGIAAIIIGSLISVQSVGTGLMFGGIFTLMDGYFTYWPELPD